MPRSEPGGVRHLALVGPTASGKSAIAMEVARRLPDVELVSVDAMQVYRGMDIGTAKPTATERAEVPHHLLDLAGSDEEYSVSAFQAEARRVLVAIEGRGHRALLVGGTGLYLQAIVDDLEIPGRFPDARADIEAEADTGALHRRLLELDPVAAGRTEAGNRRRIVRALEVTVGSGRPFSSYGPGIDRHPATPMSLRGVWLPRAVVAARIEDRYRTQLAGGFLEEVRQLASGPGLSRTARQALGYRELLSHLEDGADLAGAVAGAVSRTRVFARRQRVWFRRDRRIVWFGATANPMAVLPALLGDWGRWPSSP